MQNPRDGFAHLRVRLEMICPCKAVPSGDFGFVAWLSGTHPIFNAIRKARFTSDGHRAQHRGYVIDGETLLIFRSWTHCRINLSLDLNRGTFLQLTHTEYRRRPKSEDC